MKLAMPAKKPLVEAPASDSTYEYTTLGYLEAYDAVINCDYAFVAYVEQEKAAGTWRVRIKSSQTAGGVFEPEAMATQARAAGAQGKPYFIWGYNFEQSAGDQRCIEFRVHVANGKPAAIEMFAQMRNADGTAAPAQSTKFDWPGA